MEQKHELVLEYAFHPRPYVSATCSCGGWCIPTINLSAFNVVEKHNRHVESTKPRPVTISNPEAFANRAAQLWHTSAGDLRSAVLAALKEPA